MIDFQFAIPAVRPYLDRICTYSEADSNCTIWTVIPPSQLPTNLHASVKPIFPKRLPSTVCRWILRWRLASPFAGRTATVYWAMGGLFSTLHQKVQRYRSALTVHACVSPVPLWYDDAIVPPHVRDKELLNRRRRNMAIERRSSRSADLIIVQAERYRLIYSEAFNKPTEAIRVIPNAVLRNSFHKPDPEIWPLLKFATDHPTFVYAGNFWRFKGTIDLLAAFADVYRRFPAARLLLVGTSFPNMKQEMKQALHSLGIYRRVKIVERLSQKNLFALIQKCKGLIHPSYYEGMPRTVLEAMDLHTPVIASRIGGIEDIDPAGASISFISPGNPPLLAAKMINLLQNREEGLRRAEIGAALIEANHRPEIIGSKIRRLCNEMLKAKSLGYFQQNTKS